MTLFAQLLDQVSALNDDASVHGIIVQLPFDSNHKIDADRVTNLIAPHKDVDGLSDLNAGRLLHGQITGVKSFVPCTPAGCMELIRRTGVKVSGANAVVIGRSKIVGAPMAQILLWNNASVVMCHSRTPRDQLIHHCQDADILVVAVGVPRLVQKEWIKPGAVIIDCGITSIPDATRKSGSRLVGDVDFDACREVAAWITPVPGGVGPMTVAMLIYNTVVAAEHAAEQDNNVVNGDR